MLVFLMQEPTTVRDEVTIVHADVSAGVPLIAVKINGSRPLSFLLDSGSTRMIVDRRLLRELGLSASECVAVQGPVISRSWACRVREPVAIEFDGTISDGYDFYALDLAAAALALDRPVDGILGAEFFDRFVVTIDYRASAVTAGARRWLE